MLERLQLLEATDIGVARGEVGLGLLARARLGAGFLMGNGIRLAQILPTICRNFRQIPLGRNLTAASAGLRQFLIDLRSINLGQQVALVNSAAYVLIPAQQ